MQWADSTLWWLLAGGLIAIELMTGTFYLLMLALGAGAAALAAHAGAGLSSQLLAAAVVGGGATVAWHLRRGKSNDAGDRVAQRNLLLDIGEVVHVNDWHADGSAQVSFRGSSWAARLDGAGPRAPGPHEIVAVEGNRLILRPR